MTSRVLATRNEFTSTDLEILNLNLDMCQGLTPYIGDGHPTLNRESLYWSYKILL